MNFTFLYVAVVIIWGSTWYTIKLQLGVVEPMVSVTYRFALAAIILMIWCQYKKLPMRYTLAEHLRMAALGLFLFSSNYAVFYEASVFITTGLVAVTFSTIIILNIINGALFLGNRVSLSTIAAGLIGITGIVLVFLPDFHRLNSFGIVLCAIGTLLASFGNIISASSQRRKLPVIQTNAWGMTYGALFLTLSVLWLDLPIRFEFTTVYIGSLVYLALFGSVLAFGSYLTLIGRVGPERAAYATVLFPIVALIISTFLEDYVWTLTAFFGVILVLIGNLLITSQKLFARH